MSHNPLDDIIDINLPDYQPKEDKKEETMTEKIKKKRELLLDYALNPNSTEEDFNKIIEKYGDDVSYTVQEALDLIQNNFDVFPMIESLVNNHYNAYYNRVIGPYLLKYAKEHNDNNYAFIKINNYKTNPYYNNGVSNKEFNTIWKQFRKLYPDIKDSDKDLTYKLFSIEELKDAAGYVDEQKKVKLNNDDKAALGVQDFSAIKNKGQLYNYWRELAGINNNYNDSVFGNITADDINHNLENIKFIIVGLVPTNDDLQHQLYQINNKRIMVLLQQLNLPSDQYMIVNVCNSVSNPNPEICWREIFDKVLNTLPKSTIIVPLNLSIYQLFGCNDDNQYYKYNNHIISPVIIDDNVNEFKELLNGKKVSVKRANSFKTDYVIDMIKTHLNDDNLFYIPEEVKSSSEQNVTITSNMLADLQPTQFIHSDHAYTYQELENELNTMDGYNIVYCNKTIGKSRKYGFDKTGKPYICLRKDKEKRFYYVDPTIMVGYSYNNNAMTEESLDRMHTDNIKYNNIYKYRSNIEDKTNNNIDISFYNTDFTISTYIMSEIKNRFKYQEGMNTPRVVALDFETEMEATKVKSNSTSTKAKCRLCSLFDINYKTFYTAVIKDPKYHKDVNLSDITEHDGYEVHMYEFIDEKDLWKWLNDMLAYLDPDIITGWNVEQFDLTYAIVRSRTLDVPIRSKYGEFTFIKNGKKVAVDGIAILDYMQLYRVNKMGKMESYTLEYICNAELGKGKREKIIDDHDEMYFNYLREYTLYNIEDVERIGDLENKKNFLKFEYELCNVCNISFDDIYAKTRLIDGLVYNYAWDNHHTLLKARSFKKSIHNIGKILYDDIAKYYAQTGTDLICDGTISLSKYLDDHYEEFGDKYEEDDVYMNEEAEEDEDKGYEGAVVLKPQTGLKEMIADLDASQMYPRLMIRSNIFKDTLCAVIAINNEDFAEKWLYNRDEFPNDIIIKEHNQPNNRMLHLTKEEFGEYLKDKILTPFGTIYWKPSVKRSIISNILFELIANRTKYKNLLKDTIKKIDKLLKEGIKETDQQIVELKFLCDRYDNLQMAYKSLINSFYGVMGMLAYRLADVFSAASITASGRELTRMVSYYSSKYMDEMIKQKKVDVPFEDVPINVKTLIGLENIENRPNVIYGDTDSAFLWMDNVVKAIYGDKIGLDERIDHTWEIIERVSQYINKWIIIDILRRKGIDTEDADKDYNYEYKKELVMSKVLFGEGKKQYAYKLVLREGIRTNKIDIKGMTAIKSDNFRFAREFSQDIINYMLTEYDVKNPAVGDEHIKNKYNEALEEASKLIDNGDISIGKPSSITQELDTYKSIAAPIKGMILYDILFDHEYKIGNKGYQYYLTSINWEKLNKKPEDVIEVFKEKCSKYKWFAQFEKSIDKAKKRKDHELNEYIDMFQIFFDSITIPIESEKLNTEIFTINKPKTLEGAINKKIKPLMDIIGIEIPKIVIPKIERKAAVKTKKKKDKELESKSINILDDPLFRL